MSRGLRWSGVRFVAAMLLVLMLVVGGYGMYLAGSAGRLPWQEDPTRIPITPFADIPGFGGPTATPARGGTPAAHSTVNLG